MGVVLFAMVRTFPPLLKMLRMIVARSSRIPLHSKSVNPQTAQKKQTKIWQGWWACSCFIWYVHTCAGAAHIDHYAKARIIAAFQNLLHIL